jgi:hypothetical protein
VWNQEVVEHRGGPELGQRVDGASEEGERQQVLVVALNRREVLCCQVVDLGLCSTRVSELGVDVRQRASKHQSRREKGPRP